jgi:uncharacterized secreted protein with C-terminal beta-propeller domain
MTRCVDQRSVEIVLYGGKYVTSIWKFIKCPSVIWNNFANVTAYYRATLPASVDSERSSVDEWAAGVDTMLGELNA